MLQKYLVDGKEKFLTTEEANMLHAVLVKKVAKPRTTPSLHATPPTEGNLGSKSADTSETKANPRKNSQTNRKENNGSTK